METTAPEPLAQLHPSWLEPLAPIQPQLTRLLQRAHAFAAAGGALTPPLSQIMAAYQQPFLDVRVLILGQDPYPRAGVANGLAFSVAPGQSIPASLRNIFREYCADTGYAQPRDGDLRPWSERGVMLLNTALTTTIGSPNAHRDWGWETLITATLTALNARKHPLVAILWGRQAQAYAPLLDRARILTAPHPSPLSAHRGFFGSKPFTAANTALTELGAAPINWKLPAKPVPQVLAETLPLP